MISSEIPRIIAEIVSYQFFPSFLSSLFFFFFLRICFFSSLFFSFFSKHGLFFCFFISSMLSLHNISPVLSSPFSNIFTLFFPALFSTLIFAFFFISCHPIKMLDEAEVQIMLNNLIFNYMPRNPRTELEYDMYEGENNN